MPRVSRGEKWKLRTSDKRKRQTYFDHEPNVLTAANIRAAVQTLSDASIKPMTVMTVPPEVVAAANQLAQSFAKSLHDMIVGVDVATGADVLFTTQYLDLEP